MRAVILAAGVGKRLGAFTRHHPKSLLSFGGKSPLRYHPEQPAAAGVEDISIVPGHLPGKLEQGVPALDCPVPVASIANPRYAVRTELPLPPPPSLCRPRPPYLRSFHHARRRMGPRAGFYGGNVFRIDPDELRKRTDNRRFENRRIIESAEHRLRSFAESFATFVELPQHLDAYTVDGAWDVQDRSRLGDLDALILSSAHQQGCRYLLSEALPRGEPLDAVTPINPFLVAPHELDIAE